MGWANACRNELKNFSFEHLPGYLSEKVAFGAIYER